MDYFNAFWVGGLICALVQILLFLVILGIPVLVSEFAVGRGSHTSVRNVLTNWHRGEAAGSR